MDIVILGLVILDIVLFISLSRGGMGGIARQYGEYCVAASPLSRGEFVGVDVLDDPLTPLSRGELRKIKKYFQKPIDKKGSMW